MQDLADDVVELAKVRSLLPFFREQELTRGYKQSLGLKEIDILGFSMVRLTSTHFLTATDHRSQGGMIVQTLLLTPDLPFLSKFAM